jgi:hypothetical protein
VVGARLQRHVGCGASSRAACLFERNRFGMWTAAHLSPAPPKDRTHGRYDYAADRGIGGNATQPALCQRERVTHVIAIVQRVVRGYSRSPPSSSPISASKSLVSRKLR